MSTNPSHRLIGLDPGLRFTGWGVIDVTGPKLVHVANGSIASKQADAVADAPFANRKRAGRGV